MHCGNLCKLASNFKIGAITSSTHAQKWSKAFGWISPQVMKFRKFSLGRGSGSRLTKNTPLLRRTHGQSVCVMMWPEKFWLITNSWGYPGKQNHNYYFLSLANFHTFGQAPLSMKLVINERCSSETVIRAHLSGFNLKLLRVNSAMKSILGSLLSPMINYIGLLVTTCQNDTSSHYIHDHSWEVQSNVKVQKVIKIQNIFSKHDKKWLRLLSILFIVTKPHSLQGKQKWFPNDKIKGTNLFQWTQWWIYVVHQKQPYEPICLVSTVKFLMWNQQWSPFGAHPFAGHHSYSCFLTTSYSLFFSFFLYRYKPLLCSVKGLKSNC